ncbi:hypothetical protein ACFQMA_04745 [Halosimplex aquaticum]|uniref:Zinc-ribbon domain-containing protein n=1 Tax=Halosimplex aquaticum TaxID=3026162 RepID=A0ABD5Y090_9EURY|nr:hypothetical protein [Halosimplex aquaticum]
MKWRCAWCDKPHDRNDPPCDNCGHHKFEKAVVPVAPDDPDHEREPVWVCPECGRVHQKNSPPCSRCGNARLERRVPDESDYDDELSGTSYVDLLSARYVAGLAVAAVAGTVLILGLLGVITLPGTGGDVPGSAESVNGVDLAETETAFVAELNDRRADAGFAEYERHENLDDAARVANQRWVREQAGEGSGSDGERALGELDGACGGNVTAFRSYAVVPDDVRATAFESPEALGTVLVDAYENEVGGFFETPKGRIGVDVHAGPDDRVSVTVIAC